MEKSWYHLKIKDLKNYFEEKFVNKITTLDDLIYLVDEINNETNYSDEEEYKLKIETNNDNLYQEKSWCFKNNNIIFKIVVADNELNVIDDNNFIINFKFEIINEEKQKIKYNDLKKYAENQYNKLNEIDEKTGLPKFKKMKWTEYYDERFDVTKNIFKLISYNEFLANFSYTEIKITSVDIE